LNFDEDDLSCHITAAEGFYFLAGKFRPIIDGCFLAFEDVHTTTAVQNRWIDRLVE
jgi:hypothetical protein